MIGRQRKLAAIVMKIAHAFVEVMKVSPTLQMTVYFTLKHDITIARDLHL